MRPATAAPAAGRPRVVLDRADRQLLADALDRLLGLVVVVEEHLTVAAARSGTVPSAWTEARLDGLRAAASELRGQVLRAPLDGD